MKKWIIVIILGLFSLSCGEDDSPTKREIQKEVDTGSTKDYCKDFNWYGDGKCDTFCMDPDPDCMTCDANPCEDGYHEVTHCTTVSKKSAGDVVRNNALPEQCVEKMFCGKKVYCELDVCETGVEPECPKGYHVDSQLENCPADAACYDLLDVSCGKFFHFICVPQADCGIEPDCPEGYVFSQDSSTCAEDSDCYERTVEDRCGKAITFACERADECSAIPVCAENEMEVERCHLRDQQCYGKEICGKTISCTPKSQCLATPTCQDDEVPYGDTCPQDTTCRQEYLCSTSIFCGPQKGCDPPQCEENEEEVSYDCGVCRELIGCGQMIWCAPIYE